MQKRKYRGVERRNFHRLDVALQVKVTIITDETMLGEAKSVQAKSRNISAQGICIETKQVEIDGVHMLSGSPGAQKNKLDMEIELPPRAHPLKAMGEVCWYDLMEDSEEFMFQMGIVFISFEGDGAQRLSNYLKNHKKSSDNFFSRIFNKLK